MDCAGTGTYNGTIVQTASWQRHSYATCLCLHEHKVKRSHDRDTFLQPVSVRMNTESKMLIWSVFAWTQKVKCSSDRDTFLQPVSVRMNTERKLFTRTKKRKCSHDRDIYLQPVKFARTNPKGTEFTGHRPWTVTSHCRQERNDKNTIIYFIVKQQGRK